MENNKPILKMADPMIPLLSFQQLLDNGESVDPHDLDEGYLKMYDEPSRNRRRYSYAKVLNGEIQTLAIFGLEDPLNGVDCYSIGYAVKENHRGHGLAIEAVNKAIDDFKIRYKKNNINCFLIEAVIDVNNKPSITVAEKIFNKVGIAVIESESNTPALLFRKLVSVE